MTDPSAFRKITVATYQLKLDEAIRERNEALAEAAEYKQALTATHQARVEGEKQARAKAIEEAAKVVTDAAAIVDHPQQFADAILALGRKPE